MQTLLLQEVGVRCTTEKGRMKRRMGRHRQEHEERVIYLSGIARRRGILMGLRKGSYGDQCNE
jgi:hypothetical protein